MEKKGNAAEARPNFETADPIHAREPASLRKDYAELLADALALELELLQRWSCALELLGGLTARGSHISGLAPDNYAYFLDDLKADATQGAEYRRNTLGATRYFLGKCSSLWRPEFIESD